MAWTDKRIPKGPQRPGPLIGQPERTHNPTDDHGVDVAPHRKIPADAGWLVCGQNDGDDYPGWNQLWRN